MIISNSDGDAAQAASPLSGTDPDTWLDDALADSFPASDPIAIHPPSITRSLVREKLAG